MGFGSGRGVCSGEIGGEGGVSRVEMCLLSRVLSGKYREV